MLREEPIKECGEIPGRPISGNWTGYLAVQQQGIKSLCRSWLQLLQLKAIRHAFQELIPLFDNSVRCRLVAAKFDMKLKLQVVPSGSLTNVGDDVRQVLN